MIPTLNELETAIIGRITECEPGGFFASVDFADERGNELTCDVSGWIYDEEGDVSVNECNVYHYDAEGNDLPYDSPDLRRIESEASSRICEDWREAREDRETEDMLCWGGWFV